MKSKRFYYYLSFFYVFLLLLQSCNQKISVLTTFLTEKEKIEAANFLLKHSHDLYGVSVRYENKDVKNLNSIVNNYLGEADIVDSLNARAVRDTFWDKTSLETEFLVKNIRLSFSAYEQNPLKMKVPDSIFYEYILPYRVGDEELNDWRIHFNKLYINYLNTFDKKVINEKFIVDMVHNIQEISFHVYDRTGLAKYPISTTQSLREIREVAHPYDCEDYAVFKLYSFRSIGLPAAFETVPLYGKFNFGHSETSLWHRDGKFHCTEGKSDMPYKFQIAKMYRRRFSATESPYQKILAKGEKPKNIPDYFKMKYYEDITSERTLVNDVTINLKEDFNEEDLDTINIAYLCVYNDGEWKPVEWAIKDNSKTWNFKNMGRQVIYHVAVVVDGQKQLIGSPLLLDSLGKITKFQNAKILDFEKYTKIDKFDRSSKIDKGYFELFYWNNDSKKWIGKEKFNSLDNNIDLKLTENILYKIQPRNLNNNPRPFSIKNNEQIWW